MVDTKKTTECGPSPHGWTLDTLEEYLSTKIRALGDLLSSEISAMKDSVASALVSSEKALIKAETATEKRFDSVNEFRQTLSDQATHLLSRAEYTANHKNLEDKISTLQSRMDTWEGKSKGIGEGWGVIVAAGGLATGILIAVASYIR